jgi:hypothetical protein
MSPGRWPANLAHRGSKGKTDINGWDTIGVMFEQLTVRLIGLHFVRSTFEQFCNGTITLDEIGNQI